MENMYLYDRFCKTPEEAKTPISAGRLKGFTDINPMWRFKVLTEAFGPCGIGWKYEITDRYILEGANGEKKAFVDINLYYCVDGKWSEAIPGTGGSAFICAERSGMYTDDECFKKALTDAIGVSCKALGMSADIYFQKDRTKYTALNEPANQEAKAEEKQKKKTVDDAVKLVNDFNEFNFIPACADCGAYIDAKVHDYSVYRFKKPLCRNCQKNY